MSLLRHLAPGDWSRGLPVAKPACVDRLSRRRRLRAGGCGFSL